MNKVFVFGNISSIDLTAVNTFLFKFGVKLIVKQGLNKSRKEPYCFVQEGIHFDKNLAGYYGYSIPEKNLVLACFPPEETVSSTCFNTKNQVIDRQKLFCIILLHELMHIWGLKHCKEKKCLMSKNKCDASTDGYCFKCLVLKKADCFEDILCQDCLGKLRAYKSS